MTAGEDLLFSHRLEGGEWTEYSEATSVTLGGENGLPDGEHTFHAKAKDAAGNVGEPAKQSFTVDTIAPEVEPADVRDGTWRNGSLFQDFTASDPGSGLADEADASFTLTASEESADRNTPTAVSRMVRDKAGNETTRTLSAFIDVTKPVLNISDRNSGTSFDACGTRPIRPSFAPADVLSGLDGSQGDTWRTPTNASGVGTYAYTARAGDKAGNAIEETREYRVAYGAGSFQGPLPPIKGNGTSRFGLGGGDDDDDGGATIPVKFKLHCSGKQITNAVASLSVKPADGSPGPGTGKAISTDRKMTDNRFRHNGSHYQFNLSTKKGYVGPDGKVESPTRQAHGRSRSCWTTAPTTRSTSSSWREATSTIKTTTKTRLSSSRLRAWSGVQAAPDPCPGSPRFANEHRPSRGWRRCMWALPGCNGRMEREERPMTNSEHSVTCPHCEAGELRPSGPSIARCDGCEGVLGENS